MNGRAVRRGGVLLAALGALWLTGCCCPYYAHHYTLMACGVDERRAMTLAEREVRDATNYFLFALDSMFTGDLMPMSEVWSHADDVTLMSPYGGTAVGWRAVHDQMLRESRAGMSGRVAYADLLVRVAPDGRTAWTVGRFVSDGFRRNGLPASVDLRSTSIWRREGGHWHLAHLQADPFPARPEEAMPGRVEGRPGPPMGQGEGFGGIGGAVQ